MRREIATKEGCKLSLEERSPSHILVYSLHLERYPGGRKRDRGERVAKLADLHSLIMLSVEEKVESCRFGKGIRSYFCAATSRISLVLCTEVWHGWLPNFVIEVKINMNFYYKTAYGV